MHSLWMVLASFMFALMGAGVKFAGELNVPLAMTIIARGLPSVLLILAWAVVTKHSLRPKSLKIHFLRNLFGATALIFLLLFSIAIGYCSHFKLYIVYIYRLMGVYQGC